MQPALPLSAETDRSARRIAHALDGLPLALELAAARARGLPLTAIEDGMADRLAFVSTRSPAGREARHHSLANCLTWSTALLGERARSALAALAVVEGRCSLAAAEAVIGPSDRPDGGGAMAVLEELVDHSLVRFLPDEGAYLVLETVREHARATVPDEARRAYRRLARWVADLAASARPALEHADLAVLDRLDHDAAAVRTVLAQACAAAPDDPGADGPLHVAADVVADLAFWWSLRGRCREGLDVAARLSSALAGRGTTVGARLRWAHAFHAVYAGDLAGGLGLAAELAAEPDAADDVRARAMILLGMAQAFDDPVAAAPVVASAAELAAQAGDRWAEVEALQVLAYTHLWRGDQAVAVACADAALPALEQLGHHQLRAWDAAIRAEDARLRGDVAAALRHGRAGWALAVEVGEPVSAAGALTPVIRTLCRAGRQDEAAGLTTRLAAFLDEHPGLGAAEFLALCRAHVAVWAGPGPAGDEIAALVEAAALGGLALVAAEAGGLEACARLVEGRPERALAAADRARERARAAGALDALQAAGLARCVALHRLGTGGDPLTEAHDVLVAAHDAGYLPLVVDALDVVAGLVLDAGRGEAAVRLAAAAAAARDRLGYVPTPVTRRVLGAAAVDALDADVRERARTEGTSLDSRLGRRLRPPGPRAAPAPGERVGEPHPDRARRRRAGRPGAAQPGHRRPAPHRHRHRPHPPAAHLRQARPHLAGGAGCPVRVALLISSAIRARRSTLRIFVPDIGHSSTKRT